MGLQIDLHALHRAHLLGVLHALLGAGKARRAAATAAPDTFVGLRAVMQNEAFDEQIARRVAWGGVEDEVLIAEIEVIALLSLPCRAWALRSACRRRGCWVCRRRLRSSSSLRAWPRRARR
jgi:hypothetical protein